MNQPTDLQTIRPLGIILKSSILLVFFLIVGTIVIYEISKTLFTSDIYIYLEFISQEAFKYLILLFLAYFFTEKYLKEDILKSKVGLSKFTKGTIFWATLAIALSILMFYLLRIIAILFTVGSRSETNIQSLLGRTPSFFNYGVYFLSIGVLSPIFEEIYLRGFIFRIAMMKWRFVTSFLVSFIIMCILYPDPLHLVSSFVISLFTSLAYYQSRTLYKPIVFHVLYNLGLNGLGKILPNF